MGSRKNYRRFEASGAIVVVGLAAGVVVASIAVSYAQGMPGMMGGGSSSSSSSGRSYSHGGGGSGGNIGAAIGIGVGIGSAISTMPSQQQQQEQAPHDGRHTKEQPTRKRVPPVVKTAECQDDEDKPCVQYPNGTLDQVAEPMTAADAPERCGLLPDHVQGLQATSIGEQRLIITRCNKPGALRYYLDEKVQPKPESIKEKTCRGLVTGKDGKSYHSDIDLFLVLRKDPNSPPAHESGYLRDVVDLDRGNPDPNNIINILNQNLRLATHIDKQWVQHGDQVSFVRRKDSDVYDVNKSFEQMPPGEFERFVVTDESGGIRVICGDINLKRYFEVKKIPYPIAPGRSLMSFAGNEKARDFYLRMTRAKP
jgi:hypothetical protein